jgi:hypothetical protein
MKTSDRTGSLVGGRHELDEVIGLEREDRQEMRMALIPVLLRSSRRGIDG